MKEITFEIEILCSECGTNLERDVNIDDRYSNNQLHVSPCEECLRVRDMEIINLTEELNNARLKIEELKGVEKPSGRNNLKLDL